MKQSLLSIFAILLFASAASAQSTVIYSEDFNGTSHTFSLNTTDLNSVSTGYNDWVVNNSYTGGSLTIICMGFPLTTTIPNSPAQPNGITGAPNSNYLHVVSDDAAANNINNANYRPADGFCAFPENYFTRMSSDISTTGMSNVELSFWWAFGGASGTTYGEVYYSTNSGTSWTQITSPISQYLGQTNWVQQTLTDPAFDNQSTLRFGWHFVNLTASGGSEPSFSIDDVVISGQSGGGCVTTTGNASAAICQGDSILLGGAYQTSAGNYVDTLVNAGGCDSILTTALTVNQGSVNNVNETICDGDSIFLAGAFQTTAGTYTDLFADANGCDSVVVTNLSVAPSYNMNATAQICDGDSILLAGAQQTTAGVYTDVYTTSQGCDSIVITTLSVSPTYNENVSAGICTGDSIFLAGSFQTTAGTYTDLYTTAAGCDSIVITTLTVGTPDTSVSLTGQTLTSGSATGSYQWIDCVFFTPVTGETNQSFTPTVSGEYAVVVNENGCSDTSRCVFVFIVGVEENELSRNATYFPNPVEDELTVQLGKWYRNVEMELFDATGRRVNQSQLGNRSEFKVDLSHLATGIYVLRLSAGEYTTNFRVVKE